jgi:hypothetical protein
MKRTSFLVSLAGIAALALPLSSIAQDEVAAEAPPPLSEVWVMVVKPGMESQFNEAMATHMQFRKDAGEARSWQAYRVALGHNVAPIQYRSCCFDWADLDTYDAADTEMGLGENFQATVGQYVEHYHHYLASSDWENSHWPETGTSGPYYGVTSYTVKTGRGPASAAAAEDMSQLAKNDGWATEDNNWLWLTQIGGDSTIAIVTSHANYADMADPEQSLFGFAAEKLGEEEAGKMFDDFSKGFTDSDYTIWKLDESISTPEDEEEGEE